MEMKYYEVSVYLVGHFCAVEGAGKNTIVVQEVPLTTQPSLCQYL
jgi:hypothetical protein